MSFMTFALSVLTEAGLFDGRRGGGRFPACCRQLGPLSPNIKPYYELGEGKQDLR